MATGNKDLQKANKAKKDEFYTQRGDIEEELRHYSKHFENKVVYCNCDDPISSEFWQFFVRNFKAWKIKKLLATHYETEEKNFTYKLELTEDTNGDGRIDWEDEPTKTALPCNGDFRSAACIELLKEADIVVTNPPFSLFRAYVEQLMEYNKKFIILGNMNAITYKDFFPLLKEDKVWTGYGFNLSMVYKTPYPNTLESNRKYVISKGFNPDDGYVKVPGVCWYTNLDITKRHENLDLRGNYYSPEKYPSYDNYDGIEVKYVNTIPCDYDGVMGVPITFFGNYNPEQFEIIGLAPERLREEDSVLQTVRYKNSVQHKKDGTTCSGNKVNDGPVIVHDTIPDKFPYYTSETVPGKFLEQVYARVLIRKKK